MKLMIDREDYNFSNMTIYIFIIDDNRPRCMTFQLQSPTSVISTHQIAPDSEALSHTIQAPKFYSQGNNGQWLARLAACQKLQGKKSRLSCVKFPKDFCNVGPVHSLVIQCLAVGCLVNIGLSMEGSALGSRTIPGSDESIGNSDTWIEDSTGLILRLQSRFDGLEGLWVAGLG